MENYAPVFRIISIVCFSIAGVSLLLALFLFFKFKIISVIGDLTGKTARKSIEKMREENEKSGVKSHRPTPLAKERGPITKPIEEYKLGETANATTPIANAGQYPPPDNLKGSFANGTAPMPGNRTDSAAPNGSNAPFDQQYAPGTAPIAQPNMNFGNNQNTRQTAGNVTTSLHQPAGNATTPLNQLLGNETTMLNEGTQVLRDKEVQKKIKTKKVDMHLIQNIVLVHTDEYI